MLRGGKLDEALRRGQSKPSIAMPVAGTARGRHSRRLAGDYRQTAVNMAPVMRQRLSMPQSIQCSAADSKDIEVDVESIRRRGTSSAIQVVCNKLFGTCCPMRSSSRLPGAGSLFDSNEWVVRHKFRSSIPEVELTLTFYLTFSIVSARRMGRLRGAMVGLV